MSRYVLFALEALAVLVALGAVLERQHVPRTPDQVPPQVLVACAQDHPDGVIQSITERTMMDGRTRYALVIADPATQAQQLVSYLADGKAETPGPWADLRP